MSDVRGRLLDRGGRTGVVSALSRGIVRVSVLHHESNDADRAGGDVAIMEEDLVTTRNSRERGAAIVEFAIVVPLLLLLLLGSIEFGRAYSAKISVTHAAREGVREYALTQDASAGDAAARGAATALDPSKMTVAPSGCGDIADFGDPATLRVSYRFDFNIPFVALDRVNIQSQGVMRCGG